MHVSHGTAHGRGAVRGSCNSAKRSGNVRHAPVRATAAAAPPATVPHATLPAVQLEDKFLAKNLPGLVSQQTAGDSLHSLDALRAVSWKALPSVRMPTTRNEEYRYTDITSLLRQSLTPAEADAPVSQEFIASLIPAEAAQTHVVLVNGILRPELSNTSGLPKGGYVGGAAGASTAALALLGSQAGARGGPFSLINGAVARDVLVVDLPAQATVSTPLYVLHVSTSSSVAGSTSASAPRLLVHAGAGASCGLVEEWVGPETPAAASTSGTMPYFACAVAELFLGRDAQVSHGYVVREAPEAAHIKATLVEQAEGSSYDLTEARLGGALTRHDVVVTQTGARTSTTMRHFILAGPNQLHDLHTKLALDHPEGVANQLHKCIATASTARGVFDGNVRVGRLAQRSDAGQLSRNLLLAPRATVNIKPNLQIVADDVKCTHGCAVSDLSEEELFYFRARGINALAARQALVSSFGAEVTQHIKLPALQTRMQADTRTKLAGVDLTTLEA